MIRTKQYLPEKNKLSVLIATILLAYSLTRFLSFPERTIAFQIAGVFIEIPINIYTIISIIVVALTASGADWLVRGHPNLKMSNPITHWLLPSLTSLVIGFPIIQLPFSPTWIASFLIGGITLTVVLVAEYITIDTEDLRQPIAASALIVVSFIIFLTFSISLRLEGYRLILTLPAIFFAGFLVSLRSIQLQQSGRLALLEAGCIALVACQVAAALHYWPISPISFGLAILGITYPLTILATNIADGNPYKNATVGPSVLFVLFWGVAYWLK